MNDFNVSELSIDIEKISKDTYLKVFEQYITKSELRPKDFNNLNNKIKLYFNNENFKFETGVETFENLQLKNSDRFQYTLPYFNFEKNIDQDLIDGSIFFTSSGSNKLKDTNNLLSNIINDVTYKSPNFITDFGINNSYDINLKNLNSIAKNNSIYKSSPQIELMSQFVFESSLPLIKSENGITNLLEPKLSLKINPSDMKNYSSTDKKINVDNIFASNRLGFTDTFEAGRSLTVGLDYKKQKTTLNEINKYFEFKLATVLRDKEQKFIPKTSTINRKNSNIFGSVKNKFSENLSLKYDFAIDNDYNKFEYNDLSAKLVLNNFITEFNFIEENGEMGNSNVFENKIKYNLDENNFISFNTRRNRRINLTEYYDLVYQYKNDCLTAGIKYKKTYYEDRDLKPTEDLLFTITLFPLTTYEYEAKFIEK